KSPALSMDRPPPSPKGRKVAILTGSKVNPRDLDSVIASLAKVGLVSETIGAHAGAVEMSGKPFKVNRAAPNAPSVIYDAVLVPPGAAPELATQTIAQRFLHEAWRHGKPMALADDGQALLEAAGVPKESDGLAISPAAKLAASLLALMKQHRYPSRTSALRPA